MKTVLGTQFETSLRLLVLLLAVHERSLTEGEIVAIDYIASYASDFGISTYNLHGNSQYRFNELTARRELIKQGLKRMVMDGFVDISQTIHGFFYSISSEGLSYVVNLDNAYANDYYDIVTKVTDVMREKTEDVLFRIINQRIIKSVQKG